MLFQGSENSKKLRFLAHCAKIAKHKNMELNLSFSTFFQYSKTRSYIILSFKMWVPQVVMQPGVRQTPKNAKIVKKNKNFYIFNDNQISLCLVQESHSKQIKTRGFSSSTKTVEVLVFLQNAIISGQPRRQSKYTGTKFSH